MAKGVSKALKPTLVSGVALADHLACEPPTIAAYLRKGVIAKTAAGKYDQTACRVAGLKHLRERSAGRAGSSQADLSGERAKLATSQREGIDLKNAILRGEVASLSVIRERLETMFTTVRERILTVPGKLADALAMRDRETIELLLRDELYEVLSELSDPTADYGAGAQSVSRGASRASGR